MGSNKFLLEDHNFFINTVHHTVPIRLRADDAVVWNFRVPRASFGLCLHGYYMDRNYCTISPLAGLPFLRAQIGMIRKFLHRTERRWKLISSEPSFLLWQFPFLSDWHLFTCSFILFTAGIQPGKPASFRLPLIPSSLVRVGHRFWNGSPYCFFIYEQNFWTHICTVSLYIQASSSNWRGEVAPSSRWRPTSTFTADPIFMRPIAFYLIFHLSELSSTISVIVSTTTVPGRYTSNPLPCSNYSYRHLLLTGLPLLRPQTQQKRLQSPK